MEAYDYNVHSAIDFHCEKGHKLVGETNLVCQQDGEWSGESPKCECKHRSILCLNFLNQQVVEWRSYLR